MYKYDNKINELYRNLMNIGHIKVENRVVHGVKIPVPGEFVVTDKKNNRK